MRISDWSSDVCSSDLTPPVITAAIPVGDGASLLSRRPHIRQAERELAASTARIGAATAELYPDINLGGSFRATSAALCALFTGGAFPSALGPRISSPFPHSSVARARTAHAAAPGAPP